MAYLLNGSHVRRRPAPAEEAPTFAEPLPGTAERFRWHGDFVTYRRAGSGPPLLLVHDADVGASAAEWRRNIEPLASRFTVLAVDLPGFGESAVHQDLCTADLYVRFLSEFVQAVPGRGASAIGSVRGASYLVRAAARWPALFDRLVLVCPAGLSAYRSRPLARVAYHALGLPVLSAAVCNSATSRYAILEHLQHDVYADDLRVGESLVDARHWRASRPEATCVERARIAGLLNTDIRAAVRSLRQPVLLAWGKHATTPPLSDAEVFRELRPGTPLVVFEKSALAPHEEEPGGFDGAVLTFLGADSAPMDA